MIGAEPYHLAKIGQRGRAAVKGVDQISYLAYPCVIFTDNFGMCHGAKREILHF